MGVDRKVYDEISKTPVTRILKLISRLQQQQIFRAVSCRRRRRLPSAIASESRTLSNRSEESTDETPGPYLTA